MESKADHEQQGSMQQPALVPTQLLYRKPAKTNGGRFRYSSEESRSDKYRKIPYTFFFGIHHVTDML